MAITLPNLGLKVWNAPTDPYNSEQLAQNWYRMDEHDHSPGKGRQLPGDALIDGAVPLAKLASDVIGRLEAIEARLNALNGSR